MADVVEAAEAAVVAATEVVVGGSHVTEGHMMSLTVLK